MTKTCIELSNNIKCQQFVSVDSKCNYNILFTSSMRLWWQKNRYGFSHIIICSGEIHRANILIEKIKLIAYRVNKNSGRKTAILIIMWNKRRYLATRYFQFWIWFTLRWKRKKNLVKIKDIISGMRSLKKEWLFSYTIIYSPRPWKKCMICWMLATQIPTPRR